mmetsp:Transcript_19760/g.29139  ORF Transcript_19760/g.29139 Transcript_19760/m.29139 type:complete len:227 (-) Transcript_19760:1115-1795(-)
MALSIAPLCVPLGHVGLSTSFNLIPECNWDMSESVRTSFSIIPTLRLSSKQFHFCDSTPPTVILPRASVVVLARLGGDANVSPIAVSSLVFPLDSSPRIRTTSPGLQTRFTPRHAQAFFELWAAHKSDTARPLLGEDTDGIRAPCLLEASTSCAVLESTSRKGATLDKSRDVSIVAKRVFVAKVNANKSTREIPLKLPRSTALPFRTDIKRWTTSGASANTPQMVP